MKHVRLMAIEDSLTIRGILENICERTRDCQIVGLASDAESARSLVADCLPNVITLDLALPGVQGLEFLEELTTLGQAPVIVLSSSATRGSEIIAAAEELGAVGCFDKAFLVQDADRLIRLLRKAAAKARVGDSAECSEEEIPPIAEQPATC